MVNSPYPGGWEEKRVVHDANDDIEESEEQSHLQNLASPPSKKQRAVNRYAIVSNRSFAAIRQETVLAIQNFLTQRIVPAITSSIEEIATAFTKHFAYPVISC